MSASGNLQAWEGSSSPGSGQFSPDFVPLGFGNGPGPRIQKDGGREVKRDCHVAEVISAFQICIT